MSNIFTELRDLGVDIDEGLKRFMNNEALYERMLGKFSDAAAKQNVMECFEKGDLDGAVEKAHTLKGVTGNLSITPLYKGYTDIVALLRGGKPDEARKILEDLLPVQEKIIGVLSK